VSARSRSGWREITGLAAPVVVSKLSYTAMSLVDTAMVGHLGATEQGAVGIATTTLATLYVVGLGLIGAVNTFVSQNHGAGRHGECGRSLGQGLRLAVLSAAATTTLLMLARPLFPLAGLSPELSDAAFRYLLFRNLGTFSVFGYWAYNSYLEGLGETKTPMRITIVANLLNIVLDYLLIFGAGPIPAMGVEGAGLATAIASTFMLVCFVWVVHRPGGRYRRFGAQHVPGRPDGAMLRGMVRLGTPMAVQLFLEIGAFLAISVMIGWMGDEDLAAYQVALRIVSVSFMTTWGISIAATTLVGRHLGQERPDLAEAAGWRAVGLGLIVTGTCAIVFLTLAGPVAGLFTPFPAVAATAAGLVRIAALFQLFDGIHMVCHGALRGAGDTRWPMWAVISVSWGVGIPLVWTLAFPLGLGVHGAWLALVVQLGLDAALLAWRFRSGRWKTMRVLDLTEPPGSVGAPDVQSVPSVPALTPRPSDALDE